MAKTFSKKKSYGFFKVIIFLLIALLLVAFAYIFVLKKQGRDLLSLLCRDDTFVWIPKGHYDTTIADLGSKPEWNTLDIWQNTITRDDFHRLITEVYTVGNNWKRYITINENHAIIRTDTRKINAKYRLNFIEEFSEVSPSRNWNSAGDLPPTHKEKPLAGIHIAIDPGHIGGDYARMEQRWFQIGNSKPVMEGELTLETAIILKDQLIDLGARVYLVRKIR